MFYDEYGTKINQGSLIHFTNKHYPAHILGDREIVEAVATAYITTYDGVPTMFMVVNGDLLKDHKGIFGFELDDEPCYGVRVL